MPHFSSLGISRRTATNGRSGRVGSNQGPRSSALRLTPTEAAFHGRGHIEKPTLAGYFQRPRTKTDADIYQPENSKTAPHYGVVGSNLTAGTIQGC